MTISFILNGEDIMIEAEGGVRLVDILRKNFSLIGTKTGCDIGYCGACSVIINGEMVKSCLIPAFKAHGSEIITIEGISQTDEYKDLLIGFKDAKSESCGICTSGKMLAVEALLSKYQRPSRENILFAFQGIRCRCTSVNDLVRGINSVVEQRRKRLNEH